MNKRKEKRTSIHALVVDGKRKEEKSAQPLVVEKKGR